MKFLLSLPLVLFPVVALAEATAGYGFVDDSVVVVGIIAVVVVIGFVMFRRRK